MQCKFCERSFPSCEHLESLSTMVHVSIYEFCLFISYVATIASAHDLVNLYLYIIIMIVISFRFQLEGCIIVFFLWVVML